ncbi:2-hydroxychromene-2-carboxylate isomerase [Rhodanobacter sp. B05]|uniref:2-hydroxychromene-2-carboxylate isomerase n=1 Tax=Rhodanobacter sp. B05 TaxID=1945859 RepID=UPI000986EEBB|nr:DsbA family protein [Rhodanobacter sp. B05]OOG55879.1 2-hydroxychromene-2-carboxylate isomerase [Rhodanobacter sp. B05]
MPVTWYFDFISPFAWLHWPKVKALAATQPVTLRPILFAGVLDRCGQKGPAEIPAKREFTYRYTLWRARQANQPLKYPPAHPFNPLAALRLCIAEGSSIAATDAIFDWIWGQGQAADSAEALAPVAAKLGIEDIHAAIARPEVKAKLRENFDQAMSEQIFGVPTLSIGGRLFWGEDAHDFAMACLRDPTLWDDAEMQRVAALPVGISRTVA